MSGVEAARTIFNSFLKTIHFSEHNSADDSILNNTLTSWNFKRIAVIGDGKTVYSHL